MLDLLGCPPVPEPGAAPDPDVPMFLSSARPIWKCQPIGHPGVRQPWVRLFPGRAIFYRWENAGPWTLNRVTRTWERHGRFVFSGDLEPRSATRTLPLPFCKSCGR